MTTPLRQVAEGWVWFDSAPSPHYIVGKRSLCGKWESYDDPPKFDADQRDSGCGLCLNLLRARRATEPRAALSPDAAADEVTLLRATGELMSEMRGEMAHLTWLVREMVGLIPETSRIRKAWLTESREYAERIETRIMQGHYHPPAVQAALTASRPASTGGA